jgi:hypothetical protein
MTSPGQLGMPTTVGWLRDTTVRELPRGVKPIRAAAVGVNVTLVKIVCRSFAACYSKATLGEGLDGSFAEDWPGHDISHVQAGGQKSHRIEAPRSPRSACRAAIRFVSELDLPVDLIVTNITVRYVEGQA